MQRKNEEKFLQLICSTYHYGILNISPTTTRPAIFCSKTVRQTVVQSVMYVTV